MPSIRGIYYAHPVTGEAGIWAMLGNGNVVGRTQAQLDAWVASTGTDAQKIEQARLAAIAYYQASMEESTRQTVFFSGWSTAEKNAWLASPPPFYRASGNNVIAQLSVVDIQVLSLVPLYLQITISNGASGSETKYG